MIIPKLDAAQSNVSDAIALYTLRRYLGAWTLSAAAYHCLKDYLSAENEQPILEKACSGDSPFPELPDRIRHLWNMIKHADRSKKDIHLPNEEDARAIIAFAIMDIIRLKRDLSPDQELFLAWQSACFQPLSKQFEELGERYFPGIGSLGLAEQLQRLINALGVIKVT